MISKCIPVITILSLIIFSIFGRDLYIINAVNSGQADIASLSNVIITRDHDQALLLLRVFVGIFVGSIIAIIALKIREKRHLKDSIRLRF